LSNYYERAGRVVTVGKPYGRTGSVTAISAVSPPGGDISEPVTQNTLRVVRVFWGLDATLARQRHFPSINWMTSYSLYADFANTYYDQNIDDEMSRTIKKAASLLQEESRLLEIVRLVGFDSISDTDKLKLEIAKSIREDFLQQNAFDKVDAYSSLTKQFKVLKLIIDFYRKSLDLFKKTDLHFSQYYTETQELREKIARIKFIAEDKLDEINKVAKAMNKTLQEIKNSMETSND
jgi:V/A-type H+-transporting ATPase subunit A